MQNKKYYLLILGALLIYFFLFNIKNTKISKVAVSFDSEKIVTQAIKKTVKQQKNRQPVVFKEIHNKNHVKHKEIEHSTISYLQAYREYKFFKQCYWVIRVDRRGDDLEAVFKQKVKDFADIRQLKGTYPTQAQKEAFHQFKNKCFDLMQVQTESFNTNVELLKKKYQKINPVSEEEKSLHKGLVLYKKYKAINKQIFNQKQGKLDNENPLVASLKRKIFSLKSEIDRVKWESDYYYTNETKQLQVESFQESLHKLENQLDLYRYYDTKLLAELEESEAKILEEMVLLLKENESPDILLDYGKILFHPYIEKKLNIDIFGAIKIYDPMLAASIYDSGVTLTACALNYPCDKDSLLSFGYCFNNYFNHNEACGKSVEDYFFTEVISPNQIQDVENFITYVLKNYAKN